jgi:hypothetical protein
MEKYGRARQATDDNIIRRVRFACWITKATGTNAEHVILIALPRPQCLGERMSILYSVIRTCPSCYDTQLVHLNIHLSTYKSGTPTINPFTCRPIRPSI